MFNVKADYYPAFTNSPDDRIEIRQYRQFSFGLFFFYPDFKTSGEPLGGIPRTRENLQQIIYKHFRFIIVSPG